MRRYLVYEETYDVVIAGAGIAGASLAYFLRDKGLKVLLLDIKPFSRVGDKACGDAIGKHHIDELGVPAPEGTELDGIVKGIDVYSPNEDVRYRVLGEGYEINRIAYTQKFIKEAVKKGVEYRGKVKVLEPIIRNGYVSGVVIADSEGVKELKSKVVVDATGVARVLARQCPSEWPVSEDLEIHVLSYIFMLLCPIRTAIFLFSFL